MSNARHGLSKTHLYHVWGTMVGRCNSPSASAYPNYGAKGITVCDEWTDPYKFMGWALLNGYREGLTIERLNVYKGYSPNNCTWIPGENQYVNKRIQSNNSSGFVGVSFHKDKKKWIARVVVDGKRKEVGGYATAELANQARLDFFVAHDMQGEIKAYELQQENK